MAFAPYEFADRTRSAGKVLVVDLGFLGDAIHLIPALREIRCHYPEAELHLLSTAVACEVIALAGCVDRLWPLELRPERRSLAAQWKVIRQIRGERFDVAINLTAADRSVILMGLTRARQRLALLGGRWHVWNRWFIPHWLSEPDPKLPIFRQLHQALAEAGFSLQQPRFDLVIPEPQQKWAEDQLPAGSVHLSLCAASPLKEWPVDHYVALVEHLRKTDPSLSLAVSASNRPREQARLQEFGQRLRTQSVVTLPPSMSLAQLAALLTRCRLHIGPDSGVIHLAMALGVPTVSFFRRRGEGWRGWVPVGDEHHTFMGECTCERDRDAPCLSAGVPRCLETIHPRDVALQCHKLLAKSASHPEP